MNAASVIQVVKAHEPLSLSSVGLRQSAVLVPLRYENESRQSFEVILTRRSSELPSHAGQVSFPGGGFQDGDVDIVATALRETFEEIGVGRDQVTVVGRLDDVQTITGYHVTPVVGTMAMGTALVADESEVARVFTVPLNVILDASRWEQHIHEFKGSQVEMWQLLWDGETIWGATAYMLRAFRSVLLSPSSGL